jgi:hypothetical protein
MNECTQCEECRMNDNISICLENLYNLNSDCTSFWAKELIYITKDKQIQRINKRLEKYYTSKNWINIGSNEQDALIFLFTCEHKEHYFEYLNKYIKTCGTNISCHYLSFGFCNNMCPSTNFNIPWPNVIRNFEEFISIDRQKYLEEFLC